MGNRGGERGWVEVFFFIKIGGVRFFYLLWRDEWAAKKFLAKSHLNPTPPAINNDQSLGGLPVSGCARL